MNNPGGTLPANLPITITTGTTATETLEQMIRRVVREELAAAKKGKNQMAVK